MKTLKRYKKGNVCVLVARSYLTLYDPMDCSPPGLSVHRILLARTLEWIAISSSRRSSLPRDQTQVSCVADRFFYRLSHQGSPTKGREGSNEKGQVDKFHTVHGNHHITPGRFFRRNPQLFPIPAEEI